MADSRDWPDIPYAPWSETSQALHLYSQIVGKYRLARTPWVNHSWHATLYVCATGLCRRPHAYLSRSRFSAHLAFEFAESQAAVVGQIIRPGAVPAY